ncbi:VOC family protein [Streptomyces sp. NBC_01197]|uniref:VOC family protein n=1 Tax=Streptomyces sp. NBC_01197 TaxID=2903768 RepID=UPI002E150EC0|nr:VOC family protein [Streptomyces sp. NBC_01197]
MDIRALGYLRLETAKFDEWRAFTLDVLGMIEAPGSTEDTLRLRLDDRSHRITVTRGATDRLLAAGWEVRDAAALAAARTELTAVGVEVEDAKPDELAERRVQGMFHCQDPAGNQLEIFWGQAQDHTPAVTPYGNRFVTGDLGLGHVVLPAPNMEEAYDFYEGLFGFTLRDSMRLPSAIVPGGAADRDYHWMHFMGCNPRHHSLGLFPGLMEPGIVHFMVEVATLDDVGRGLDRIHEANIPVASTLGRHTNDLMVSFYAQAPGGFQVEYGTEGRLVDDTTWVAKEMTADSFWGHKWNG